VAAVLSDTLDPSLEFLGVGPEAVDPPPPLPAPALPEWLVEEPEWRWAPVDCACREVCSCRQWIPTVADADFDDAWASGWFLGPRRSWPPSGDEQAEQAAGSQLASPEAGWAVPGVWPDRDAETAPSVLPVGGLVQRILDGVAVLETLDPTQLPDGQALAEAEALLGVGQRLRVLQLARLADADKRSLYGLRGFRSAATWLKQTQPDADTADLTMAKRLPEQPVVDAAVRTGTLSLRAARKVQASLRTCRPHVDRPDGLIDGQPAEALIVAAVGNVLDLVCRQHAGLADDDSRVVELDRRLAQVLTDGGTQLHHLEQAFVILAEHLPVDVLKESLDELVYALVPNLLELAQQKAEAKRAFRVEPTDSGWRVSGELTPECGERLITGLAAEARRDASNPLDTEAWEQVRIQAEREGRDPFQLLHEHNALQNDPWAPDAPHPDSGPAPRSRGARLHDALSNLLNRYLTEGLGGTHDKVPVQIIATITSGTIEGRPGALPGKGGSGRPLARSLLRRWWCDAHVTALVMSRGWKPLGIAHTARTLTGLERNAIHVQFDQRCIGIGCCRGRPDPLTMLVPHHVRKYAADGITVLEESLLFCESAHHDIHTGKKTLRLRDGRLVNEEGWVLR